MGLIIHGGRLGVRGAAKGALPKIYYTCPAMMKLGTAIPYLKKILKIFKLHPWGSTGISISTLEITKLCYIKK